MSRILDGFVLPEEYARTDGHHGQNFSIYAIRGLWHQSWVTNRGELLVIEGKLTKVKSSLAAKITPLMERSGKSAALGKPRTEAFARNLDGWWQDLATVV